MFLQSPGNNIGTQELVARMNDTDNESDEITSERLTLDGGQVTLLEPFLIPLVVPEPDLRGQEHQLLLHVRRDPGLEEPPGRSSVHDLRHPREGDGQGAGVVEDVAPELLHLWYPRNVL